MPKIDEIYVNMFISTVREFMKTPDFKLLSNNKQIRIEDQIQYAESHKSGIYFNMETVSQIATCYSNKKDNDSLIKSFMLSYVSSQCDYYPYSNKYLLAYHYLHNYDVFNHYDRLLNVNNPLNGKSKINAIERAVDIFEEIYSDTNNEIKVDIKNQITFIENLLKNKNEQKENKQENPEIIQRITEKINLLKKKLEAGLSQNLFISKAEKFLNVFTYKDKKGVEKKETLGKPDGLCLGLTVMMIRAWMIGEGREYINRLNIFNNMSDDEIVRIAHLLKEFGFGSHHNKEGLKFAQEMYMFIQSTLFAQLSQNPENFLLRVEDNERGVERDVILNNLVECIKIIAPNQAVPIQECLKFGFLFKESKNRGRESEELTETLKSSVQEGDLVFIGSVYAGDANKDKNPFGRESGNHAMFLMRTENKWLLIDPNSNNMPILQDDSELSREICQNLFYNLGFKTDGYLPINFNVITKNINAEYKNLPRQTEEDLLNNICKKRINKTEINAKSADGTTALHVASRIDNMKLVDALIKQGAIVDSHSVWCANTKAMQDKLGGGVWGFVKRNWKGILLGTFAALVFVAVSIVTFGAVAGAVGIAACFSAGTAALMGASGAVNLAVCAGTLTIGVTGCASITATVLSEKKELNEKELTPKKTNAHNSPFNNQSESIEMDLKHFSKDKKPAIHATAIIHQGMGSLPETPSHVQYATPHEQEDKTLSFDNRTFEVKVKNNATPGDDKPKGASEKGIPPPEPRR